MNSRFASFPAAAPYLGYSYGYPHKTAYRELRPPVPLARAWAEEPRDALFLYLHVPFCEQRCGFCNLFTTANPEADLVTAYLDALEREAEHIAAAIGPAQVAVMAIGGGTPTYLDPRQLDRLLDLAEATFGARLGQIPISVETSPQTATPDRLRVLAERGVTRISIGVQSFSEAEAAAAGRSQRTRQVEQALDAIRRVAAFSLNLDLIYGLPGQTVDSWLTSLRAALCWEPEELYLYPLYVRPLTGLERTTGAPEEDHRLACYRAARDFLPACEYEQLSMRHFRRRRPPSTPSPTGAARAAAVDYCCQEDGMIGIGCGARSYTRRLHYSSEFAVGRSGVLEILGEYLHRPAEAFTHAHHGFALDTEEESRRYVIKTLLRSEGLDPDAYRARFGTDPRDDLPELRDLERHNLVIADHPRLRLTELGMERSDLVGPWLYSDTVRTRTELCILR
jgi:oxygen-independent coproporphyrinogen-3 oxidase